MSMADTIQAIESTLETRLLTLANRPAIAWEDVSFTPVTGQPYLRVNHLHNTPREMTVNGGPPERVGIFQVTAFYPAGRGKVEAKQLAGRVADLFAPPQFFALTAYRLHLLKSPAIASGMTDMDGWYMVPVSIYWRAFPV